MTWPAAVLFDLDDTLFDHSHSSRSALAAVRERFKSLQQLSFDELERAHSLLLEEFHVKVVGGAISPDSARVERFRRILLQAGDVAAPENATAAAIWYRSSYQAARRPVAGALSLLERLKPKLRIGVVSNNILVEQREKLRYCGLDPFVDVLVVSEEFGKSKPEAAIFEEVLRRLDCAPGSAVMIGDSWTVDVLGARGAGIRAVWFNRRDRPCPDPTQADVIRALEPAEAVLELIGRCDNELHRRDTSGLKHPH